MNRGLRTLSFPTEQYEAVFFCWFFFLWRWESPFLPLTIPKIAVSRLGVTVSPPIADSNLNTDTQKFVSTWLRPKRGLEKREYWHPGHFASASGGYFHQFITGIVLISTWKVQSSLWHLPQWTLLLRCAENAFCKMDASNWTQPVGSPQLRALPLPRGASLVTHSRPVARCSVLKRIFSSSKSLQLGFFFVPLYIFSISERKLKKKSLLLQRRWSL